MSWRNQDLQLLFDKTGNDVPTLRMPVNPVMNFIKKNKDDLSSLDDVDDGYADTIMSMMIPTKITSTNVKTTDPAVRLPLEIFETVLANLSTIDQVIVSRVSRSWKLVIDTSTELKKSLDLRHKRSEVMTAQEFIGLWDKLGQQQKPHHHRVHELYLGDQTNDKTVLECVDTVVCNGRFCVDVRSGSPAYDNKNDGGIRIRLTVQHDLLTGLTSLHVPMRMISQTMQLLNRGKLQNLCSLEFSPSQIYVNPPVERIVSIFCPLGGSQKKKFISIPQLVGLGLAPFCAASLPNMRSLKFDCSSQKLLLAIAELNRFLKVLPNLSTFTFIHLNSEFTEEGKLNFTLNQHLQSIHVSSPKLELLLPSIPSGLRSLNLSYSPQAVSAMACELSSAPMHTRFTSITSFDYSHAVSDTLDQVGAFVLRYPSLVQ
ncbi:hypothetical protein V1514DRAFT_103930 [Lipomyces japonicus]|uniref:uncharacterized protein n=1 Tax=Lipomyces japonicus TaxID=56871 RepID=UPI0034CFF577